MNLNMEEVVKWCGWRFPLHTLDLLIPINRHLNTRVYLSIVADIYLSAIGYFQHDNALCHEKKKKVQSGFMNMTMSWMFFSNVPGHLWDE